MPARVVTHEEYEEIIDCARPQSIEQEGVVDQAAFIAMTRDPRTVCVSDGQGRMVPVATPVANLASYVNLGYYQELPGVGQGPAYYYLHLEHLHRADAASYAAALRPSLRALAAADGQLLYDFPLSRRAVDGQVGSLLKEIGGISSRHLIRPATNYPRHYHYVSRARFADGRELQEPLRPLDLYALAERHPHRKVQVLGTLEARDIDYVWPYYAYRHEQELGAHDPIAAGFNESDFRDICSSPEYIKVVYRDHNRHIINMVAVTALQNCPWLNRRELARRYPVEYDAGRILCGIMAVRKPKSQGGALSLLTLGHVHALIARDGQRVVEVGAFDEVSVRTARKLTQLSQEGTGITADFEHAVGHHVFRARQLRAR